MTKNKKINKNKLSRGFSCSGSAPHLENCAARGRSPPLSPPKPKASVREFWSLSISLFHMLKTCSLLPCPLPVMDAPRLCLQQKVKPPGFARRLPESPTDRLRPGQGIFRFVFSVFLGLLGAGLGAAAPPPAGRTRDCSIPGTLHILPRRKTSQVEGAQGLGGSGEGGRQP